MRIQSILLSMIIAVTSSYTAEESDGHHTAAHGGCLNELGACENGHAEVKVEGTTFCLWFVGGGTETTKAVRVPDTSITLTTKAENGQAARTLVLNAKPLVLAEEKLGDCSYFEGSADWLKDIKQFSATGSVNFKGVVTPLFIGWPVGVDPDEAEGK